MRLDKDKVTGILIHMHRSKLVKVRILLIKLLHWDNIDKAICGRFKPRPGKDYARRVRIALVSVALFKNDPNFALDKEGGLSPNKVPVYRSSCAIERSPVHGEISPVIKNLILYQMCMCL